MTLIEVLIVLGILGIMLGAVIAGSGQAASAKLKHSATMLTGAIRVAYTRANATSKPVRLVMDFAESTIWLEESDGPMLVRSKEPGGGAAAATENEKAAIEESKRITSGPTAPRASFHAVEQVGFATSNPGAKGPRPLPGGIGFREVQTSHDDEPKAAGRAYLYFWPGGQTERASIQLRIGKNEEGKSPADAETLTLIVSPLTGKVTLKEGAVALVVPKDDREASEREDLGQ